MLPAPEADREYRLSEIVSALTFALDLTEGQPEGHTLRACCIGMRMAKELALRDRPRADLFYTLLLKDAGCSSNAAAIADRFGADDHGVKRDSKITDWTRLKEGTRYAWRNAGADAGLWNRVRHFTRIASGAEGGTRELIRIRCERGAAIVGRLGFPRSTTASIRALDEHWDGSGHPRGLSGTTIPLNARIALLAQTLEVFLDAGPAEALSVVRQRRGTWFDPSLVDLVLTWEADREWWDALASGDAAALVDSLEPEDRIRTIDDRGLDNVAEAFAEVIDAKSPYTARHSSGVAVWARHTADELGLPQADRRTLYRAGLLHDIGKLGISNRILDKPGRLTDEEFAKVREHPLHTWEILRRVPVFAAFARTAALHHERLDGSGYPWGIGEDGLDTLARILAAADVYEALTADRPYRPGLPLETVLHILASDRTLDPPVVEALASRARRFA